MIKELVKFSKESKEKGWYKSAKEEERPSMRIHAIRNILLEEKLVEQFSDVDKLIAEVVTYTAAYVEWHEMLKAGTEKLLKINEQLIEGKIKNPIAFGAEMQRIRTYILDVLYQRKGRAGMMLAGASE